VLLLVGSGVLFAIGSTLERHQHHAEPVPTTTAASPGESGSSGESSGETGTSGESGGGSRSAESPAHTEKSHAETGATILGVNTESLALSVTATVASFLLALLVGLGRWPRLVLLAVAVFGLVFAAGDARELVHQLDESNGGLAAIAAILIGLHLAVTTLSALLYPRRSNTGRLATAEPFA